MLAVPIKTNVPLVNTPAEIILSAKTLRAVISAHVLTDSEKRVMIALTFLNVPMVQLIAKCNAKNYQVAINATVIRVMQSMLKTQRHVIKLTNVKIQMPVAIQILVVQIPMVLLNVPVTPTGKSITTHQDSLAKTEMNVQKAVTHVEVTPNVATKKRALSVLAPLVTNVPVVLLLTVPMVQHPPVLILMNALTQIIIHAEKTLHVIISEVVTIAAAKTVSKIVTEHVKIFSNAAIQI